MNNKLIKSITITNVVLVCLVPIIVLFIALSIMIWNIGQIAVALFIVVAVITIINAVFDFIKSDFCKKGNNLCEKIPASKTRIAYLVFGITISFCFIMVVIGIILCNYELIKIRNDFLIPLIFAIFAFFIGIASLVIDSIAINEWRKNKKEV